MKKSAKIISASALLALCACADMSPNLVENGMIDAEFKGAEHVRLSHVTIRREDDTAVVRGEVAYPVWRWSGMFAGHIDVKLALPDGRLAMARNVPLVRKNIPNTRGRRAFFVTRILTDVPDGTKARIAYHKGAHKKSRLMSRAG